MRRTDLLAETAVTQKRKERFGRAQRLHGLNVEGYKPLFAKNWGPIAKNGFRGQNTNFWAKKKSTLLTTNHVPAMAGQSCLKKKVPFFQMNISLLTFRAWLLWQKTDFQPVFRFSGHYFLTQKRPFLSNSSRDPLHCLCNLFFL